MAPSFTLAAAGDAMIATRLSAFDHSGLHKLADRINEADAGLVNLEVLLHDYEGYPAANGPGTYMRAPPWTADELTWLGFDAFAAATNHVMDYTHGGMEATMRELEAREIPYAGLGRTLAEARAPAYFDTPGGRVAIVAACSTITTGSEAGEQTADIQGRPGLSPLRHETRYQVPEDRHRQLREISRGLGLDDYKSWLDTLGFPIPDPDDGFRFVNLDGGGHPTFEMGDDYDVRRVPNRDDVDAIIGQIDRASRQADWVVASLHSHEGDGARSTDETVAPFVESFARECIDAGADAFVGHGSHTLRGIELYDGAPIFYSLGNIVAQNELIDRLPPEVYERYGLGVDATPADVFDARAEGDDGDPAGFLSDRGYFETVVPVCEFDDDLTGLTLHPVDLLYDEPRSRRGHPVLAEGDVADRIFDRLAALSEPYGTTLNVSEGVVRVEI